MCSARAWRLECNKSKTHCQRQLAAIFAQYGRSPPATPTSSTTTSSPAFAAARDNVGETVPSAAQSSQHWPARHPWLGCVHYLFYFIRNYLVQQQRRRTNATAAYCCCNGASFCQCSMLLAASTAGFLLLLSQSFNVVALGA